VTKDVNETTVVKVMMPRMRVLARSGVDVLVGSTESLSNNLRVRDPIIKRINRA
jgi:hypothetical protein